MRQSISKKIIIYLFTFFLLATITNSSILNFKFPNIDNIEIQGLNEEERNQMEKILKNTNLKNIFFVDKINLKKKISSVNIVEQFKVFKNYPSTLKIDIKKTKFLAITKINGSNYLIGSNGKLIQHDLLKTKLPFVFGDLDIQEFLILKENIDKSKFKFNEISNLYFFKSRRWDIETHSGYLIKIPRKNIKDSLDLFVRLSKEKNFKNKIIFDLRQNGQIIINEK